MLQLSFIVAMFCYTLSVPCSLFKLKRLSFFFLILGITANAVSMTLRYHMAFPMLPLYQGPFFLPGVLGIIFLLSSHKNEVFSTGSLITVAGIAWVSLLFPHDHFLPFIQFKTVFSHLFFWLGLMGKAFFILAGLYAVSLIKDRAFNDAHEVRHVKQAVAWGYLFWTLSVFAGALWSFIGWGSPVIWDDPMVCTAMATWLFYSLYLHTHLISFIKVKHRPILALAGSVWVMAFNVIPELGPYMPPKLSTLEKLIGVLL